TNNTSSSYTNGLGTYFNGLGWDQFFLPADNNTTATSNITQVINNIVGNGSNPITIITGSVAGLKDGAAVTISGVKVGGSNPDRINGTWIISNVNASGNSFALVGAFQDGTTVTLNSAKWTAVSTTGIHVQKLAAASDAMLQSSNVYAP